MQATVTFVIKVARQALYGSCITIFTACYELAV